MTNEIEPGFTYLLCLCVKEVPIQTFWNFFFSLLSFFLKVSAFMVCIYSSIYSFFSSRASTFSYNVPWLFNPWMASFDEHKSLTMWLFPLRVVRFVHCLGNLSLNQGGEHNHLGCFPAVLLSLPFPCKSRIHLYSGMSKFGVNFLCCYTWTYSQLTVVYDKIIISCCFLVFPGPSVRCPYVGGSAFGFSIPFLFKLWHQ